MNLLAFDTSTEYLSLALMRDDDILTFELNAGPTQSQIILPQIQVLLESAGVQLKDMHGIAFGAGPGSFTGVRIAAGVAQGLGYGANLPVVSVCTLLALAESTVMHDAGTERVIACLDARMGEVYHAAYEKTVAGWITSIAPGLYKPDAVPLVTGEKWVGAGSGWSTYAPQLSTRYGQQLQSIQPQRLPTASAILRLAQPVFARGEARPASEAMPVYIRNRVALKTAERAQGLRL
jgi:tRNA threonylcarbamoyladenosine biosynthesis protein TsaB